MLDSESLLSWVENIFLTARALIEYSSKIDAPYSERQYDMISEEPHICRLQLIGIYTVKWQARYSIRGMNVNLIRLMA